MAVQEHPTLHESSVIIGAAVAFTLDNWDEFLKDFAEGAASEFPNGMDEVKDMFIHLLEDAADMLTREKQLEMALDLASKWLRNMQ